MGRLERWWQSSTQEQRRAIVLGLSAIAVIFVIFVALAVWYDPTYWVGVYLSPVPLAFVAFLALYERWRKFLARWRKRSDGGAPCG